MNTTLHVIVWQRFVGVVDVHGFVGVIDKVGESAETLSTGLRLEISREKMACRGVYATGGATANGGNSLVNCLC